MSWPLVPIADLVDRPIETVDPRANPGRRFMYIDISSVDNRAKAITHPASILGSEAPTRARQVVRAGDVIVATTRPYLNAVARVPDSLDGQVCSTGFAVLRPKPEINSEFLFLWAQHPAFVGELTRLVQGALYPAVTDRQVLAQMVPLPPVDVQRRIATTLSAQLLAAGRLASAARAVDTGIGEMSLQGYRVAFRDIVPLSASGPGVLSPPGWNWHRLIDLARLESGHTPSRRHPEWWGGDIGWIQLADIRAVDGRVIYATSETTNADGIANSAARILPVGTVAMSRTASVGFVTRMGQPMATSQDFVNWVCGPELDPVFLLRLLIRARGFIRGLSSGAIHKTVYYPTVKSFWVCVPDVAEQRRIVNELEAQLSLIDRARAATLDAEKQGARLPAALLREAFNLS